MMLKIRSLLVLGIFFAILLSKNPLLAQDEGLDATVGALEKANREERTDEIRSLSNQILERDVVADFISHGTGPARRALDCLVTIGEADERIEDWEEGLALEPKSKRFNYLMMIASLKRSGSFCGARSFPNSYPPMRVRIKRVGDQFTGEVQDKNGRWEKMESLVIAMKPKILVGFCGRGATTTIKNISLLVNGQSSSGDWQSSQIGRSFTEGSLKEDADGVKITGAGWPLDLGHSDDIFFAFREVEGDVEFEVELDALDVRDAWGMGGIMLRASSEPGASYIALMAEEDDNAIGCSWRQEADETAKYLEILCELQPADRNLVERCLEIMMRWRMNAIAKDVADRLVIQFPEAARENLELFREIYENNGKKFELPEGAHHASGESNTVLENEEQNMLRADDLMKEASKSQSEERHDEAIASWQSARELLPGKTLPQIEHQQMLISLSKLERIEDLKVEIKRMFLGEGEQAPYLQMVCSVFLQEPGLVPSFMPSLQYAAKYGVAIDIARTLDQVGGDPIQVGAARAMAAALRLAGGEPAAVELAKKGGEFYLRRLDPSLSEQGLLLVAFQLQQTNDTRAATPALLTKVLASSPPDVRPALLAWRMRIHRLLGDQAEVERDGDELTKAVIGNDSSDDSVLAIAMQLLLRKGDIEQAEKLGVLLRERHPSRSYRSSNPGPDALELLDLHQGRVTPRPILWTTSDGESMRINWEFVPNTWPLDMNPLQDIRWLGINTSNFDGKYDLEIYAQRGLGFGDNFPKEDLLVSIPGASSTGSWTGKMPQNRSWLRGRLRGKEDVHSWTQAIPAAFGKNLLEPFDFNQVMNKTGAWSTFSIWLWGGELLADSMDKPWFISRLQEFGEVPIEHRPIPISPDKEYVFSGWLKTDSAGEARMGLVFLDANGKRLGAFGDTTTVDGRWTLVTAHFGGSGRGGRKAIPSRAVAAKVTVLIRSQCEIANLSFYQIEPR